MINLKDQIVEHAQEAGIDLTIKQIDQLNIFANLLKSSPRKSFASWDNDKSGLEIHFKDSFLSQPEFIPEKMLDIGSGAGIPGIIYAIIWPETHVILLEAQKQRCDFLKAACKTLNFKLNRIEIIQGRAEELAHDLKYREQFDFVTARALSKFISFLEYGIAFVKVGSYLHALRGNNDILLIEENRKHLNIFSLQEINRKSYRLNPTSTYRLSIIFRKMQKTDKLFPRKNKKIQSGKI